MSEPSDSWLHRTGQRWKARAAYVLAVVQLAALAGTFLGPSDYRLTCFWLLTAAAVVFWPLFLMVRCRVCGEFVLMWAWEGPDWISRLERLRACPQCGATDDSAKGKRMQPTVTGGAPIQGPIFERMRQPPQRSWVVSLAVLVGGILLLRLLAGLTR